MKAEKPYARSAPKKPTESRMSESRQVSIEKVAPSVRSALSTCLEPNDPLYETARAAQSFAQSAKSAATRRAYNSDWKDFRSWCSNNGLSALPAEPTTVALYLSALARKGRKASTISRRVVSISVAHRRARLSSPCDRNQAFVTETLQGIRRILGTRQVGKEPVTVELVRKVIASAVGTVSSARDRALILVGFAGGMRRSELAGMRVEHLRRHADGITIFLPISKTDQEQRGREVELPFGVQPPKTPASKLTCPVRALEAWLKLAAINEGPVFRRVSSFQKLGRGLSASSIGYVIKRMLGRAGLNKSELAKYGAHSLRSGFCTAAWESGASEADIMQQSGHKSAAMLRKYIHSGRRARQSAAGKIGL